MKLYDEVELNTELEELAARGIHKRCYGDVVDIKDTACLVMFYNRLNRGDYAFAWVEEKYLDLWHETDGFLLDEVKQFVATHKPEDKPAFEVLKLKEYDWVEVTVEKAEYAKQGVHKGMVGCIMHPIAVEGRWLVIFSNEEGEDIAELGIKEKDLKKVN